MTRRRLFLLCIATLAQVAFWIWVAHWTAPSLPGWAGRIVFFLGPACMSLYVAWWIVTRPSQPSFWGFLRDLLRDVFFILREIREMRSWWRWKHCKHPETLRLDDGSVLCAACFRSLYSPYDASPYDAGQR